jgi:hypothetical protein
MSLAALSTELDTNIVDFCDHESLHALSQTSKYWRTLSEPHLYNNLCFAIDQLMQMKQLLLTLLKRPDLVKHIKSFRIAPSIVPEEPVRDGFFDHSFHHSQNKRMEPEVKMFSSSSRSRNKRNSATESRRLATSVRPFYRRWRRSSRRSGPSCVPILCPNTGWVV